MAGNTMKSISCKSCGAPIPLRALGQSLSVVCNACHSIIDVSDENYKIIQKANAIVAKNILIPLGKRGNLLGNLWEVIGYMERSDLSQTYFWCEYLLFNPVRGFRWLSEAQGHWNFILNTRFPPEVSVKTSLISSGKEFVTYMGNDYFLFYRGKAVVNFVLGEFYWKVKIGETVEVEDYISPPEILSCERNSSEIIWTLGQYLDNDQVRKAFGIIDQPMPLPQGIAPNQVSVTNSYYKNSYQYAKIFISIICLIQFLLIIFSRSTIQHSESFAYSGKDKNNFVSKSFELKAGTSNLEITLDSNVNNNWLELDLDLINDKTGEVEEFQMGNEYYSGYDSDGSWVEGSNRSSVVLSAIAGGSYHLNMGASSGQTSNYQAWGVDTANSPTILFNIQVKRNVLMWGNFFIALLLISVIPIFIWWRRSAFEARRWSQSDFSPNYKR